MAFVFCREDIQAFGNIYKSIPGVQPEKPSQAKPIERTRSDGDIKLIERKPKVTKLNDEPKMPRSLRGTKGRE